MLIFVEKVVYMLYKSNTPFALEAYTGFLQSLFEMSLDVAKEATAWIVYADDEVISGDLICVTKIALS